MGNKRVKKLLSIYKDIRTISKLKSSKLQKDLGINERLAKSVIHMAKKKK